MIGRLIYLKDINHKRPKQNEVLIALNLLLGYINIYFENFKATNNE